MLLLTHGRKIFQDRSEWFHCDYMCRREVVKIGTWRSAMQFLGCKADPWGTPIILGSSFKKFGYRREPV